MQTLVISSNCSGGGKTTFTLGLMKALKDRGYKVQGFKCGPDYIDPAFHKAVTNNASRNLDTFLMTKEGMKEAFSRGEGDIAIIEGAMGLYDGKGVTTEGSCYEVCEILGSTLSNIACVVNPEIIVIGGGVSKAGDILLDNIKKHFVETSFMACRETKFALAGLGNDAGMYGCVEMLLD